MDAVVGVSHECDYPGEANSTPRVTNCPIFGKGLASREVDAWVRQSLQERGTLYYLDDELMRQLSPDIILTQRLCDVCAVGYGSVARLAAQLSGPPQVVNLEPLVLQDIFDNIVHVAQVAGVSNDKLQSVLGALRFRVAEINSAIKHKQDVPTCFLMEWVDPPFCSGHWAPELVEIAGAHDPLGRSGKDSTRVPWDAILAADPDYIVLALCGFGIERSLEDLRLMQSFPDFWQLKAVRTGNVYIVNGSSYFSRPSPRIVDSLEILAAIINPETFPKLYHHYMSHGAFVKPNLEQIAGAQT